MGITSPLPHASISTSLFKESTIEGSYPIEINERTMVTIGTLCGALFKEGVVIVGIDTAPSIATTLAPFLVTGLNRPGLTSQLTTLPLTLATFAEIVQKKNARGGVLIYGDTLTSRITITVVGASGGAYRGADLASLAQSL